MLLIPADVKKDSQVSYYSTSVSDFTTIKFIESTLRTAISKQLLLEKQIDPAVVDEATREHRHGDLQGQEGGDHQVRSPAWTT